MTSLILRVKKIFCIFLNCGLVCCCLVWACVFPRVPAGRQKRGCRSDCWASPGRWKETSKESQEHTCCFIPFKHKHHTHQHTPVLVSQMLAIMSFCCVCTRERAMMQREGKNKPRSMVSNVWNSQEVKDKKTKFLCSPGSNQLVCLVFSVWKKPEGRSHLPALTVDPSGWEFSEKLLPQSALLLFRQLWYLI